MNKPLYRLTALSLALLLVLAAVPAFAAMKGDVNQDGRLTSADLTMMKEHITGIRTLTGQALRNADMNGDGSITSTDVAQLNRLMNCDHSNCSIVGGDEREISCRDNGNGTHTQEMIEYIDYRCSDCGYTWSDTEYRTYTEPHEYLPGQTRCNICSAAKSGSSQPYTPPFPSYSQYLVPDSSTRRMTESECWNWTYDALGYVYHEILARKGFVFDPYGNYAWYFNGQSWYQPIASRNNQDVYDRLNSTEWYNVNLIKEVRQKMRNQGTTNPSGRGITLFSL